MKRAVLAITCLFLFAVATQAQAGAGPQQGAQQGAAQNSMQQAAPPNDAVFTAVQKLVATMTRNIIAGAQEMPADKYNFRPTPAQNTFGHLVVHMITANNGFCSAFSGAPMPTAPPATDDEAKDSLIAKLKTSFDLCAQAVAKLDDSKLEQPISMGRGTVPLGSILVTFVQDYGDHYAQEAGYLRAAGLIPPTSQQPAQAQPRPVSPQ